MDAISNPFTPGAGSPPPELSGRDPILEQGRILFARVKNMKAEKSLLLTGLRGVGKTVLLLELERIAQTQSYNTLFIEAHEGKSLGALIAPAMRGLLFKLNRLAGAGQKIRQAFRVLKSFANGVTLTVGGFDIGLDIDPESGSADTGDIELDLPDLFAAVGEAAADRGTAVAVLIDELQYFGGKELGSLIMAMHRMQQRRLPVVLVGAGLPILPGLAGDSKSYAERLFDFPDVGALSQTDAARALQGPAAGAGVSFDADALAEVYRLTKGYPYFIQEWGYQAWNSAPGSPVTRAVIAETTGRVLARLDQNFFRVRYDRLKQSEHKFLRAMAALGPGPHRIGEVAQLMGRKVDSLGPVRADLIRRGMVYSPAHGELAFTVPLFDEFMIRAIPDSKR